MDAKNRLCLLLLGQTELRGRIIMAVHEALAQRIVVRYHMPALEREELPAYLVHRLRNAGTELPLFEPAAHEALFQATGGLPRKLNLLAHHALLAAAIGAPRRSPQITYRPQCRRWPDERESTRSLCQQHQYVKLPGTLHRVLRQDRRTAAALHRRGVPLGVVENAFALAIARRTFRSDADEIEPLRCFQYFLPVVEELLHEPPLPEYLDYLKSKLDKAGVLAPA